MIGLPPSESGGVQVRVMAVALMSDTTGVPGASGLSVMKKQRDGLHDYPCVSFLL